jgi:hypothetical protein
MRNTPVNRLTAYYFANITRLRVVKVTFWTIESVHPSMAPPEPTTIGRYEAASRLGQGGMGSLYFAKGSEDWRLDYIYGETLAEVLTQSHVIIGTRNDMSPERIRTTMPLSNDARLNTTKFPDRGCNMPTSKNQSAGEVEAAAPFNADAGKPNTGRGDLEVEISKMVGLLRFRKK